MLVQFTVSPLRHSFTSFHGGAGILTLSPIPVPLTFLSGMGDFFMALSLHAVFKHTLYSCIFQWKLPKQSQNLSYVVIRGECPQSRDSGKSNGI